MDSMPIITLKNGVKVGNFSSPHPFMFDTGDELLACTDARCNQLSLSPMEKISWRGERWTDVKMGYNLTDLVRSRLKMEMEKVDILIVPRVLLDAVREEDPGLDIYHKVRTIRMRDRVKKINFSDKFCI